LLKKESGRRVLVAYFKVIIKKLFVGIALFSILVPLFLSTLPIARPIKVQAAGGNATSFMDTPDAVNGVTGNANGTFWTSIGSATYDTTVVKSGKGSWKLNTGQLNKTGVLADTGRRISFYYQAGSGVTTSTLMKVFTSASSPILVLGLSSSKLVLSATGSTPNKTGATTLSTGTWYRITLAYKITSTSNWSANVYVNGNLEMSASNSDFTLSTTVSNELTFISAGIIYVENIYVDNGTDLGDPGDIRVTAKRPNANGTSNQFTTQVGSGGSGYGTGHSPQVNERPISTTNGWTAPTTSGKKTEGYAIESTSTGDVNISAQTIVAYNGWVYTATSGNGAAPTNNLLVNGVATSITLSATATVFNKYVDSSTYPSTAEVIGMDHTGTGKASALYEAGIMVAYTPVISVTISNGSVAYGTLGVNTSKDTTSGSLNNTQVATNAGSDPEDLSIKGQNSANWTLSGSPGSEQYSEYFCTTGSGSPDPCDTGPTWTAMTTSYQSLGSNIAASGTQRFDLKITTPTSTTATSQQSVDVVVLAVLH
jgi:hypothetical protein